MDKIPNHVWLSVVQHFRLTQREKEIKKKEIIIAETLDKLDILLGNIEASLDRHAN